MALAHGFQGREEGAHGLANAGGSLAEEPGPAFAARLAGPVDFPSKSPLPGPVRFKGEAQGVQTGSPAGVPVQLAPGPGGNLPQQTLEERVQFFLREMSGKPDDLVGVDLVIGQPDIQPGQALLFGIDGPVDHPLCPVAGVAVLLNFVRGDGGGFDLVDDGHAVLALENAVGPALDGERDAVHLPGFGEEDFRLIALPGGLLKLAVDAGPLVGPVEPRKAAVDAARP